MTIQVQLNTRIVKDATMTDHPGISIMSSDVFENWIGRVALTDKQALIAFPKFGTVGIGFEKETDWNTNLPCTCTADVIYEHIKHNKGDRAITKAQCLAAIEALKEIGAGYLGREQYDSACRRMAEMDGK